jgi:arabinogalactan endo-1,4-beta-galactosidase
MKPPLQTGSDEYPRRLNGGFFSARSIPTSEPSIAAKRYWLAALAMAGGLSATAHALEGTANYSPAESNIAGKYWVSSSAASGNAAAALDGDMNTMWTPAEGQADLVIDLGGAYDAVHKVRLHFANHVQPNPYRLHGSTDGQTWRPLADRSGGKARGGIFTDLFSHPGLRYLRLELTGSPSGGVREMEILNYLRRDLENGSDTSEQGGSATAYHYNAGNNPPVLGVRGGRFGDPGSIESGNNFFGLTKDLGWDIIRLRVWNEPRGEQNGMLNHGPGNCSPANTLRVAKAIVGAGQKLAIDFHYADSWSDPQNQPKPYAWADLTFDELQQATREFTFQLIDSLVEQGTTPTLVALGNEVTNGMMWGSEYDLTTPYLDHHHYYTSGLHKAHPGGGVKWLKYEEAHGDTASVAYREFLDSIRNLALLIDAGNRAVKEVNAQRGTKIETQLHFAFNVIERVDGKQVALETEEVFQRVMTLVGTLNEELSARSGMVDSIGISYYPDWHGSYDTLQRNIVEISRALPGIKITIAECSPNFRGRVAEPLQNPNHPVGFEYSIQSQGDDTIELMKTINDAPNNVGTGVWPWAGTRVFGTGSGDNGTLRASFKAWNDAFAKNVLEDHVFVAASAKQPPELPATVRSLDLATGGVDDVSVKWEPLPENLEAGLTYTVRGETQVQVPAEGRGKPMTQVTAVIHVAG